MNITISEIELIANAIIEKMDRKGTSSITRTELEEFKTVCRSYYLENHHLFATINDDFTKIARNGGNHWFAVSENIIALKPDMNRADLCNHYRSNLTGARKVCYIAAGDEIYS